MQRRKYHNLGPNYVWHIDGHDKLKSYCLSIYGCIDGYSRRIIWLRVASTNKVPELIAKYYLDALKRILGKPKFAKAFQYAFQSYSLIQRNILLLAELNMSSFVRILKA